MNPTSPPPVGTSPAPGTETTRLSRQSRYLLISFIFLALCIPLICATYLMVSAPEIERAALLNLEGIARLQARLIEDWLAERRDEVRAAMHQPELIAQARDQFDSFADTLERRRNADHYAALQVFDEQGRLLAASGEPCPPADEGLLARAAAARGVVQSEMVRNEGRTLTAFAVPLLHAQPDAPVGYLVACADLDAILKPMIEHWPITSPSGETLLVERRAGEPMFLRSRHDDHTAVLERGIPLHPVAGDAQFESDARATLDQHAGKAPTTDYRGIAVLAAYQPIAGTAWQLVAKIDRDDILAPTRKALYWVGAILLSSLLSILSGLLLLGRQRERSQQLAHLAEKERNDHILNDFFNLPFVGMAIISPQTRRFIRCNEQCCSLTGHTYEELLDNAFEDLTHPEDRARVLEQIGRMARGEVDGVSLDLRLLREDATIVFVDCDLKCVRRPDGSLDYLLATLQDVTQRHMNDMAINTANLLLKSKQAELALQYDDLCRAQAALRSSNERYRAVIGSSNDALINIDSKGVIVTCNPSAERIFGYACTQIVGLPIDSLLPQRLRQRHRAAIGRLLSGGGERVLGRLIELRAQRSDGSEIDIDLTLTRWDVADGSYFTATVRDISQRKQTEHRLRLLSAAVRQSPESIVITDTQARIEFVNEAFVAQTGYRHDEVIGRNPSLLHSGNTPATTFVSLWAALGRGEAWKGEFHNRRRDGSQFIEFARVIPIRQTNGQVSHYLAIKEDITEKKRLGAELDSYRYHLEDLVRQRTTQLAEASLRAEAASRAKSAFLANMSHEIRTPMNAIVGLTHLLCASDPTPRQLERLHKIDAAASHLLELINNILDFSKIEADKMSLAATDFSLTALFDEVRSMIADTAQAKRLAIEVDLGTTPTWLNGDPQRLRQALLNYASNAVKFTERGQVTLRCTLLEDAPGSDGAQGDGSTLHLRFAVEDSGIGIAADQLPKLFQSFAQADTSDTRQYGGTGLGLAITRRLAHLMNGEAGADSQLGGGSTFWFTARLRRGSGQPPRMLAQKGNNEEALRREHRGARILLADDVAVNLEVAQLLLANVGLHVDTADNGQVAVDMARRQDYDLILLDVQMPQMNGIEATHAIRALPGYASTPILALTANAFDEDRQRCLAAGMNDFVSKPVNPDTLYAVLRTWLPAHAAQAEVVDAEASEPSEPPGATPASAAEGPLMRHLSSLAALDGGKVLRQLPGIGDAKLERIIALFVEQHADAATAIGAALAADDGDAAGQRVHTLKGSAALIGASTVAQQCGELLAAIRSDAPRETRERIHVALAQALDALFAGLQQARAAVE